MAVPLPDASGLTATPGSSSVSPGTFCSANATWKRGLRPGTRSGASSSTSFSNGTSWCAKAPSAVSRTRRSSPAKPGSPDRSVRRGSVFTKNPTSPSSSACVRPATGVPTTTSSSPAYFARSAWKAARSAM